MDYYFINPKKITLFLSRGMYLMAGGYEQNSNTYLLFISSSTQNKAPDINFHLEQLPCMSEGLLFCQQRVCR